MNTMNFRSMVAATGVPIHELSAHDMAQLQCAPQAQRKTSTYKKTVHIAGGLVFKGPYSCGDPMLMKNLANVYALGLLEEALQLAEAEKGFLPWEYVASWNDARYYLTARNVGKRRNVPFEVVSTKIETNVKVVPRGAAVKRVSDIEDTEHLTQEIKLAALQHLYLRFLLDIGDSGTHNILIREDHSISGRLIAGIDIEEKRGFKEKESRLEHLFKKPPSRKQINLYESDVCRIKSFSDRQLDQRTSDRLRAVGVDLQRINENMKLWERLN